MYAIIFWRKKEIFFYQTHLGAVAVFENLKAADITAENIEKMDKVECRVVSIGGVHE